MNIDKQLLIDQIQIALKEVKKIESKQYRYITPDEEQTVLDLKDFVESARRLLWFAV